jgi:hypothetical protein
MLKITNQQELDELNAKLDAMILESQESENSELIYIVKDGVDFNETASLFQAVFAYGETGHGETMVLIKNNNGQHRFALGG